MVLVGLLVLCLVQDHDKIVHNVQSALLHIGELCNLDRCVHLCTCLSCRKIQFSFAWKSIINLSTTNHVKMFPYKIYCINLDSRPDRWENMSREFDKHGLIVQRVSAFVGEKSDYNPCGKTLGQIGCLKSHAWVVEDAMKHGYETVMVFEDDAVLCKDFCSNLEKAIKMLEHAPNGSRTQWNLLYLSGLFFTDVKIHEKNLHVRKIDQVNATHAMVYHKRAYQDLARLYNNRVYNADDVLRFLEEKYIVFPFLASITNDPVSDVCPDSKEAFDTRKALVDRFFLGV